MRFSLVRGACILLLSGLMRAFLVVLDSVGIGEAPDAADYGDVGANTLAHIAEVADGLRLPVMQSLGLGNIPALLPRGLALRGVPPAEAPRAAYGAMREISRGKDTTTGHWEMAGLHLVEGFHVFPHDYPSFPDELIAEFVRRTGHPILGNRGASGTAIIAELGERQLREHAWIVYTSADSVFQIAAHEETFPLQELYAACAVARELCNPYRVGRVIARPFIGTPGSFTRTENRRDFSMPTPEPTILDRVKAAGIRVTTVGKLDDIFPRDSLSDAVHVENNLDAQAALLELARRPPQPHFVFANLIDFDMLYGHRRDAAGYARALEQTDAFLGEFLNALSPSDLVLITADHGNDPTFTGTDHTREFVPLLAVRRPPAPPLGSLGIRDGFCDIAQSMSAFFGLPPHTRGTSFLG